MAKQKYYSETQKCIISNRTMVDLHHVKTRKSGGSDESYNLMPLSHNYHNECHLIGLRRFAEKYLNVKNWLIANKWEQCPVTQKWFRAFEEN